MGLETVKLLSGNGNHVTCAVRGGETQAGLANVSVQAYDALSEEVSLDLPETLDGLVYFPGTITLKPFHRLSDADFLRDYEVNALGAVRLIRAALPALKKAEAASIVLFSTVAVRTGMPFHASIAAAKGAVEGLGRSLAAELAPRIRVNVIAPSLTNTPLASGLLGSNEKVEAAKNRHPAKTLGDPADFARLVDFLLSDASRFMTGQVIKMDGGLSSLRLF